MAERITQVERNGLVLDVVDAGPVDGEPIVLLHGFPERATSWRLVAPLLHEAGYRTLALDQRGYAPGARPRRRRDYRLGELAGDVRALIDLVGGTAHVVGHDWGAAVAWATTMRHPEAVRTLTAVSVPHPGAFVKAMLTSRQGLKSWYMYAFQLPWLPEKIVDLGWLEGWMRKGGMTDEDLARFRREIVDDGALRTAINWYRAAPLEDPREAGAHVSAPTTLVWSSGDLYVGRKGAELSERYVDGPFHFVELPGVSHWIPTQAPQALAEAILERVAG